MTPNRSLSGKPPGTSLTADNVVSFIWRGRSTIIIGHQCPRRDIWDGNSKMGLPIWDISCPISDFQDRIRDWTILYNCTSAPWYFYSWPKWLNNDILDGAMILILPNGKINPWTVTILWVLKLHKYQNGTFWNNGVYHIGVFYTGSAPSLFSSLSSLRAQLRKSWAES